MTGPRAWAAEGLGTGAFVFLALSGIALLLAPASPVVDLVPSQDTRLLVTGVLAGACISLLAASPLGRISGAHLNPAVTLAFAAVGCVRRADVAGYLVAQLAGAIAGAAAFRATWGSLATAVGGGVTHPALGTGAALALEAATTGLLVAAIFLFVSHSRLARFTPLMLWPLVALLIWKVAPQTDASLNPARSAGPALVFGDLRDLWLYFTAPILGALAVAIGWRRFDPSLRPAIASLCPVTPRPLAPLQTEPRPRGT